jgi:hypothetical protein
MNILIVGNCGVGKTWVMKQLVSDIQKKFVKKKIGKFVFEECEDYIVIGNYDGSTFEGSDKLSMSIMTDYEMIFEFLEKGKLIFYEGDRFSNSKFINQAKPLIIKILGDGLEGRITRGSNQTERHLKSIRTRISNIPEHYSFNNSTETLLFLRQIIEKHKNKTI